MNWQSEHQYESRTVIISHMYTKSILCTHIKVSNATMHSKRAAKVSRVWMSLLCFSSCFHVDVALSQAPTEWLPKLVAMEDQRCQMWRSSICNHPNERFQSHQRIQTFMHVHTMKHWNATVQVKLLIKATLTAWTSVADVWRFCSAHYQQEVRCLHQIGRTLSSLRIFQLWPLPSLEAPRLSPGRHIQSLHLSPPRSRIETCTKCNKVDQIKKYNFQLPEAWNCFNHVLHWYLLIHKSYLCLQGIYFKIHNSCACRHLMCHVPSNCKGCHISAGQMDKLQKIATKECKIILKVEWTNVEKQSVSYH